MGIPPENLNNKHTNMKKIMIFSAIFAVAISLSACSNNETDISYASAETITLSSTTLNFETNVMMYSERINDQLCEQFLADLERSTEYSCEEFDRRTTMMRIRMAVSWQMKLLA